MVLLTPVPGKGRPHSSCWFLGLLAPGSLAVWPGRVWGLLWAHPLWPITMLGKALVGHTAEWGTWLCRRTRGHASAGVRGGHTSVQLYLRGAECVHESRVCLPVTDVHEGLPGWRCVRERRPQKRAPVCAFLWMSLRVWTLTPVVHVCAHL